MKTKWLFGALILLSTATAGAAMSSRGAGGLVPLFLDGAASGYARSISGGSVTADVVTEKVGPASQQGKHLGQLRYEPVFVEVALPGNKALLSWVAASWTAGAQAKRLSTTSCDSSGNQRNTTFERSFVTRFRVPALDAAQRTLGMFRVEFAPELITSTTGKECAKPAERAPEKAKPPTALRFDLGGVDTSGVSRIDSFEVVREVGSEASNGSARGGQRNPGQVTFPNLHLTVKGSTEQGFVDWAESFIKKGQNDAANEKTGAIVFLASDGSEVARIALFNVGIFRAAPLAAEAGRAPDFGVDLYVERMELKLN